MCILFTKGGNAMKHLKKNKGRTPFTFARRVKKVQGSRCSGVPRLEQARVSGSLASK